MNVIDRARARIVRDGWLQGALGKPGRPMCLIGALLAESTPGSGEFARAAGVLAVELGVSPLRLSALVEFNNDPATSLEDLLLLTKRGSACLEEASRPVLGVDGGGRR